jgi:Flp pilus assembly protein TadB
MSLSARSILAAIKSKINAQLDSLTLIVGLTRFQIYFEIFGKLIILFSFIAMLSPILDIEFSHIILLSLIGSVLYLIWVLRYRQRAINRYRTEFELDFVNFIEGLSLAVNSGLPLVSGMLRVIEERLLHVPVRQPDQKLHLGKRRPWEVIHSRSSIKPDPLTRELLVLQERLNNGESAARALEHLARRLNSIAIANLADAVFLSMARGTPLANLIQNHAEIIRESQRKSLLERAGKAEVKMMVPIVFLLLPLSVLFALWPSFQQLQRLVILS